MTQTQTALAKPVEASPAKPLFGFRALLADLAGWIRRHLLTVCLVLFVILINVGTQIVCALIRQPFPPSLAKVSFEALARGRWYTAPISMLYVPNLGRLLIDVPLMLVAFGLAESVIGKIKTAWVSVITTLGGVALGMGLCSLSDGRSPQWHAISHDGAILGPLILVAGTLMCVSAFTTMLWRRRIRVIGYAVVLIMFLYRGEVSDYCLLATSVIGHVLGYLMASCTHGDEYRHGAIYEMRRLIGIVAGVQAIGSLVAVSSRQSFGLLSMFGLLTGSTDFDTGHVVDCLSGASHTDCFTQYRMMRFTMPGNWLVSIMPTLMLLLIAWGLYRGRHLAAALSIVFNACTIALSRCPTWTAPTPVHTWMRYPHCNGTAHSTRCWPRWRCRCCASSSSSCSAHVSPFARKARPCCAVSPSRSPHSYYWDCCTSATACPCRPASTKRRCWSI